MKFSRLTLAVFVAVLLSACSRGGSDNNGANPVADTFTTQVSGEAAAAKDAAEPLDINGLVVTQPDNTEPVPLS